MAIFWKRHLKIYFLYTYKARLDSDWAFLRSISRYLNADQAADGISHAPRTFSAQRADERHQDAERQFSTLG